MDTLFVFLCIAFLALAGIVAAILLHVRSRHSSRRPAPKHPAPAVRGNEPRRSVIDDDLDDDMAYYTVFGKSSDSQPVYDAPEDSLRDLDEDPLDGPVDDPYEEEMW